ncbi:hypothetical protein V8G54_035992 [Vigna mungo]|uniref:Uncharacterized protein n=1 Tax=Vigna mungo TaxID=3915 RepID=A0AAQ3RF05_VIGMU
MCTLGSVCRAAFSETYFRLVVVSWWWVSSCNGGCAVEDLAAPEGSAIEKLPKLEMRFMVAALGSTVDARCIWSCVTAVEIAKKTIDLKAHEGKVSIVEWVWEVYELGETVKVVDPKLCGAFDGEQMKRLLGIGKYEMEVEEEGVVFLLIVEWSNTKRFRHLVHDSKNWVIRNGPTTGGTEEMST